MDMTINTFGKVVLGFVTGVTAIIGVTAATVSSAAAADLTWGTYQDTNQTYINYVGETTAGDLETLKTFVEYLNNQTDTTFSGDIWLAGPGGNAYEGEAIANYIKANGFSTNIWSTDECYSACAMIWLGGGEDNRFLFEGGLVAFHLPYISISIEDNFYEDAKNTYGWQPVLDWHNSMVIEAVAADISLGIKDVVWYLYEMAKTNPSIFLEVDTQWEVAKLGGIFVPSK